MSGRYDDDPIPSRRQGPVNLVEALSNAQHMPVDALELAIRSPARIADAVLRVATEAADGADIPEKDRNLLFWGVHVLGAARETRLFGPLLRLARRSPDRFEELLGEAIDGTLPRVVAGVFDGDAGALEAAILDGSADEYVRLSLFGAFAFLTFDGRIPRDRAFAFLTRFDAERPARAGDAAWTGWEQAIALLGFAELADRVAAASEEGRLLVDDPEWFDLMMAEAQARPHDPARFKDNELGYIEDIVAEIESSLAGEDEADPQEPLRNPLRDVGRNDPCPCGSGKKFKKCCLTAA